MYSKMKKLCKSGCQLSQPVASWILLKKNSVVKKMKKKKKKMVG